MRQRASFVAEQEGIEMTNEHCIMKLNQLIESRERLQRELRHKGAYSKVIEADIAALQYAVEILQHHEFLKNQVEEMKKAIDVMS